MSFVWPNWRVHVILRQIFRPSLQHRHWSVAMISLCRAIDFVNIFQLFRHRNVYHKIGPIVRHAIAVWNLFLLAMHLQKCPPQKIKTERNKPHACDRCLPARSSALAHRVWPWMAAFISGVNPKTFFASIWSLFCCNIIQIASIWPATLQCIRFDWYFSFDLMQRLTAFGCIVKGRIQFYIWFIDINARCMQQNLQKLNYICWTHVW